jgi:hypothetical protein
VLYKDPVDHHWKPATPDMAGLAAKTGDQTLAGIKTFSAVPVLPAADPTMINQATRKAYVDTAITTNIATHAALPNAHHTQIHSLTGTDHTVSGLTSGQVLRATGATSFAFQALQATDLPGGIDAAKIGGGAVDNTEFGYLDGVTAGIQGQLDAKLATATYTSASSINPGHKHSKLWASDGNPEAVTVDADGNVSIGPGAPLALLDICGAAATYGKLCIRGTNNNIHFYYGTNEDTYLRSGKTTGIVAIQDTGGNVGIGTDNPAYTLTCNGQPGANGYTAWTNYSDLRIKQDIKPLDGDILARVLKLNPITFAYNDRNPWGEKPGERTLYGLIAQEIQEIFPDMVGEVKGPDGEKYLTTNLSNLPLYLVQAIKEQQARIDTLQAKFN